jgi:hypothetical protein
MAIGRSVADLERGDVLGPLRYVMSRFVVREYCHSVELHQPCFQDRIEGQVAPPTLVHLDKLRLYRHACPMGTGPHARVHVEYDARVHSLVPVGEELEVVGHLTDRFKKRGRDYLIVDIALSTVRDSRLLIEYRDTVTLAYSAETSSAEHTS